MTVRIGVMGCADIARRRMLPAMAAAPGVEIAAVASRFADKAQALAARYGARPVHGYARLLDQHDVDAVYLPLPAALHGRWVEAALDAGKHVLAEKPLTLDRAHTAAVLALARSRGLALMENVMFVHHGQHRVVRRLVAEGAIGESYSFQAAFTVPRRPVGDIRLAAGLGGGALWDVGVYPVRAALHLLGRDLAVVGAALSGEPVDLAGRALLRTPGGVTAELAFGLDHPYASSYELRGTRGRITVDHAFSPAPGQLPDVRIDGELIPLQPDDQAANTVAAFAAAVRAGRAPGDDSLRQAELLEDIRTWSGGFPSGVRVAGRNQAAPVERPRLPDTADGARRSR